jgi:hypothetical protein
MVAAIRNVDFRQFTSVALATDRHGMTKLASLLGSSSAASGQPTADSPAIDSPAATNAALPARPSSRRRFDR